MSPMAFPATIVFWRAGQESFEAMSGSPPHAVLRVSMDAKQLFEILVREHSAMLLVYLRAAVREPALVDDLYQETLLVAWRTLDRFDRTRPFGPWLRGIAAKLVMAERRKAANSPLLCGEQMLDHLNERLTALQAQPGDTL